MLIQFGAGRRFSHAPLPPRSDSPPPDPVAELNTLLNSNFRISGGNHMSFAQRRRLEKVKVNDQDAFVGGGAQQAENEKKKADQLKAKIRAAKAKKTGKSSPGSKSPTRRTGKKSINRQEDFDFEILTTKTEYPESQWDYEA